MTERFEDTPDLFGHGAGTSTCGDVICEFCRASYNEGEDKREVYDNESVLFTEFAGLQACGCCFGAIERAVLSRMHHIIPWYKRWLDRRVADCNRRQGQLDHLKRMIRPLMEIAEVKIRPDDRAYIVLGKDSGLPIGHCDADEVLSLVEETPGLRFEPCDEDGNESHREIVKEKPMKCGESRYWVILSQYDGEAIGKCMSKDDVLSEEPGAKFKEIDRAQYYQDT